MSKPIVVGVDIGTTTGMAIYDLDRNLLYVGNKRNISIDNLIREISFYGKPLIIATDKKRIPHPVSKIAASFNCKVFNPDHDLTIEEKDNIIRIPIKDVHEKDALAAATFAYKNFAPQFSNIDRNLESLGMSQLKDKVKEMIINKEAKNIAEAIEKLKPREENVEKKISKEIYLNWRERAKEMEKKLNEERRRYEITKTYCEKLEDKSKDMEKQKQEYLEEEIKKNEEARKKVMKDKEVRNRDILIKQLQFELFKQKNLKSSYEEQLRVQEEYKSIEAEKLIPVIIIDEFTKDFILRANKKFGLEDRIVWVKNFKPSRPSTSVIISLKPKVIIGEVGQESKEAFKKSGIIVVDTVKPDERRYFASVSPERIENDIKRIEKKDFLNWLDDYRKRSIQP